MDSELQTYDGISIKQEPISPRTAPRSKSMASLLDMVGEHDHDMLAMQQTYRHGEEPSTVQNEEQRAIDMSCSIGNVFGHPKGGRSSVITAGMSYISDTMSTYVTSGENESSMYGIYAYSTMQNGRETTENGDRENADNKSSSIERSSSTKTRNTALPGMGKRSHLPKRYKCAMCAYRTRYKSDLNRHVRKHAVATYNCDVCNMPFKTVGNVEFHKRKEHANMVVQPTVNKDNNMKHMCNYCTYGTMYSSDLTRHLRKHYAAQFHCTVCNRPFMTSGSLVHHKRTVHGLQDVEVIMGPEGIESVNQTENGEIATVEESGHEEKSKDIAVVTEEGVLNLSKCTSKEERDENEVNIASDDTNEKEECNNNNDTEINENTRISNEKNKVQVIVDKEVKKDLENSSKKAGKCLEPCKQEEKNQESMILSKHTCEFCHKTFGRKLVLDYHLKNIHKVASNQNDTMFVEYPDDDYDLALDMSIQELENSTSDAIPEKRDQTNPDKFCYQCQFCAYATNYKSTFDRHVRKHDLECHICNVCRMPFITFGHLQRHIRDNHPDHIQSISKKEVTNERHSCSYCDYAADSLPQLQLHCEFEHGQTVGQTFQRRPLAKRNETSPSVPFQYQVNDVEIVDDEVMYLRSKDREHIVTHAEDIKRTRKQIWTEPKKVSVSEEGVTVSPPSHGRYAKLVSDYENFAERPFACALCFFRTSDLNILIKHAENHLTGCNPDPVPETAVFAMNRQPFEQVQTWPSAQTCCNQTFVPCSYSSERPKSCTYNVASRENNTLPSYNKNSVPFTLPDVKMQSTTSSSKPRPSNDSQNTSASNSKKMYQKSPSSETVTGLRQITDRLIPTFSVHYRKDKTNKIRPYLCLLCRKRFKHLTILKQHFRLVHNDFQANTKPFNCRLCNKEFDSPMMLQEHHDITH